MLSSLDDYELLLDKCDVFNTEAERYLLCELAAFTDISSFRLGVWDFNYFLDCPFERALELSNSIHQACLETNLIYKTNFLVLPLFLS